MKIHRCVVNTVVVWLHILGPYWCLYGAVIGGVESTAEQWNVQKHVGAV